MFHSYPVACLILLLFVDNNGIRTNCPELLEKFERDVVADKRIDDFDFCVVY